MVMNLKSPGWHETVLKEREKSIATGRAQFIYWEVAKAEIREEVSNAARTPRRHRLQRP